MSDADAGSGRTDPLFPNTWLVAKREFREQVRSRVFKITTVLLALLAVGIALIPLLIKVSERGTTSKIAVVTADPTLASEVTTVMGPLLNPASSDQGSQPKYVFVTIPPDPAIGDAVANGEYDGALLASRGADQGITFQFIQGDAIGADRVQNISVGALGVGVLDWVNRNRAQLTSAAFVMPSMDVVAAATRTTGTAPVGADEYAARRIVGVVFVVVIFITVVIYGMWVAAGVVAEKSSRVMEILISAASPRQLVLGKVLGIGMAGLVQYLAILVPALVTLLLEDRIATAVLGEGSLTQMSLSVLSPMLLGAYGIFWILGFTLYSLIYAAAGSLVSRAEDLQVMALPLSMIAIVGYLEAVLALSGGLTPFMRFSSFVPFWSPFVMLTRMTIGRAEAWEVGLAFLFLVLGIALIAAIAIRVYSAGVLLYGQRPGFRRILDAVVNPPV
jgi:ABC-2 type transport system permease protein